MAVFLFTQLEEGRLLQVTGGMRVTPNRKSPEEDDERITTPLYV